MYRGRAQLGQTVSLLLLCRSAVGTASLPDSPPVMKIYGPSGGAVRNKEMPILERYAQSGLFHYPLFLNADFSPGQYHVLYYFRVGADYGIEEDHFEVVAGGNQDGEITAMHFYQRPHADFIVQGLESGKIVHGRNPRV